MRFNLQSPRVRAGWATAAVGAYVLAFFLLYPEFGASGAALAILPVTLIAWLGGTWIGFLAGVLNIPVSTLLLNLAAPGYGGWDALLQSGGPGSLGIILIGLFVGYLHDVQAELTRHLTLRQQVEATLKESEQRYRALANAAQRQTRELTLLDQVRQALADELELPLVIQTVVEGVGQTFGYSQVSLYLIEGELLKLQHQVGYHQVIESIPVTEGISGRVVRTGQPVLLEDVRCDPAFLGAIEGITSEVCVPLFDQGRVVGILNVESTQGVTLTEVDLHLMLTLSEKLGFAVSRARLYAEIRESQQRFESAVRYAAIGMALVAPDGRWLQVNQALCQLVGYPEAELLATTFQAITHSDDLETDLDYVRQMMAGEIQTYHMEKRYLHKRGHVVWILLSVSLVRDSQDHPLYFISQIQDITERKRAEAALRESETRYRGLFEDSPIALWEEDFSEVKQRLDELRQQGVTDIRAFFQSHPEAMPEWAALVKITDVNAATLRLYRANSKAELLQNLERVFSDESYSAFVEELMNIADGRPEFEWEGVNQSLAGERLRVSLHWSVVRGFEDSLSKVIVSLIDITERKRAEEQLLHDAFHDTLTGLPNRALFLDRVRQALERARRRQDYAFAVLFLDFDRFKMINDSLGHMIGDQFLVASAHRLAACLRAVDTVARLGGDEFVIFLEDVQEMTDATCVADRIQKRLETPFPLGGHDVVSSASIGIVLSTTMYERPEDILRDADTAMYHAKALGKARYEMFHPNMRARAVARLKLETDLRRAVEQQEFRIHYQPIVSLATGRITGFEALVRWQHPELGLVLPDVFMTTAEETGLIVPIGYWTLKEACWQLKAWQDQSPTDPPMTVSVNLSSQQFMQPELDQHIKMILDESRLAPGSLRLEITERTIIDDTEATASVLAGLKDLGVELEIDDFGTGYSALSYLHRLQLDALKIDQSFVRRLGTGGSNSAIIRTILALGQILGLRIIAEGVETEDQLAQLKMLGCQSGQGFLLGKPMSSEDIAHPAAAEWQGLRQSPVGYE